MVHFIGKSKENREWFDEMLKKYGIHINPNYYEPKTVFTRRKGV